MPLSPGRQQLEQLRAAMRYRDPDERTRFLDRTEHRDGLLGSLVEELSKLSITTEDTDIPILIAKLAGARGVELLRPYRGAFNANVRASVAEAIGIAGDGSHLSVLDTLTDGAKYDWLTETISSARATLQARLALGRQQWHTVARLDELNLNGCNLRKVNWEDADLSHVRIEAADLRGANLRRARMRGTFLFATDLCGASMGGADLEGADLERACLRGADLRGATGLTAAQLGRAFSDGAML